MVDSSCQSKNGTRKRIKDKARQIGHEFFIYLSRLGRRGAMMAGAVMFAFSYLVLVLAPNVWFVYVGR